MIAVLAGGYLAIGAVVAALGMRRGARALELLALLVTWPLYAPLWLERLPPARDRATVLATAFDRVGVVGDTVVTAADAPLWLERLARATAELAALEQTLAVHRAGLVGDRPVLVRAAAEHQRRRAAATAIDGLFDELAAQVALASWLGEGGTELPGLLAALAAQLAILDPGAE